ncbi:unnamed protein product [Rotaria magnacalcarata]|uniref:Dynein intermediate chain 2, axonemal n=4 Tax=Rotaria magnacalcarata TaxID=392030 RepID=A0A816WZZ3_9BILA|nr:unnamed protein product [Rotaria magnacalcarata]CAF1648036.1 unnamed protein product [Rotaria magnacalcarata]CAF2140796.1 unnamed protein product [Rotaria magnacalcarata]CAF3746968.1 unnamed protein product [Rotaria magnacalcarata]CAF3782872.1 unnamed protein product [Rotaria magnacalcarata]
MDIQYVYTKKRSEFGRQVHFTDRPVEIIADIQPNPELIQEYISRNPVEVAVQNTREFSEHWVNTVRFETENRGINHVEGGWPKDVNPLEPDQTSRFRKKTEKEDGYGRAILSLGQSIEHTIRQNNAIDIYENYFQHLEPDIVEEAPYAKTINIYRDPHNIRRTANHISWYADGPRKLAVSYCNLEFQSATSDSFIDSYIWNIENPTKPELYLKPISPLVCIEFNPKDTHQLAGGCYNGQVCIFDTRKGSTAVEQSLIENSHRDPAYKTVWLQSKSGTEFFSASTDGKVLWWDTRKLSEPVETLILDIEKKGRLENALGAMSLEYEPTLPTKFMVGTEQGRIISCNRKGKNDAEKIGSVFPGHWGPVYALQRHPNFTKNFLSVGDWTVRIWSEELRDDCIMWTKPSMHALTDAQWSPTRSSIFYTSKMDGTLDVWDILFKQNEPTLSIQVVDEPLHCLRVQETQGRLIACGSQNGTVTLVEVSDNLCIQGKSEKALVTGMFDRETRRAKILEARGRAKRDARAKSAQGEKGEKATGEGAPGETELREADPIEKAEKDFWKIIEEEKRKRDRKAVADDEKPAAETGVVTEGEGAATTTA